MHNRSMIYGYARVSSNGQDLAQQLAQLDAAGCTKIYREKVSAATAERPQLKRAIGALDAGDVLMVTATDRSEEHTSELQSLMRISYAVFCLKKKKKIKKQNDDNSIADNVNRNTKQKKRRTT